MDADGNTCGAPCTALRTIEFGGTPPTAECSTYQPTSRPGEVQVDGTESEGEGLLYEWDFGDGTIGSGFVDTHVYETPGEYTIVLTVTNNEGLEDTTTCDVEIDAPTLGVALSFPESPTLPDGTADLLLGMDDELTVRITVSAGTDGVGDLDGVAFDEHGPLRISPSTTFEVVTPVDPPPPESMVLAPGDDTSFDVVLEAVGPGAFTLTSTVVATDAAGREVGPVEASRGGRVGQLDVEIEIDPAVIELAEGDDGEGPEPEDVTVTVKVTNPYPQPVDDVTVSFSDPQLIIQRVPPLGYRSFHYLVPAESDDDSLVEGRPDDVEVGTIGPGETEEFEVAGLAVAGGTTDLRTLALGSIDGVTVSGAGVGRLEVKADVMLVFDAEVDPTSHYLQGGAAWVDGGDGWSVRGTFENRTPDEDLLVLVTPMLRRNASFGIPIPKLASPPDDDCAVGMSQMVEPGEVIEWDAPVQTSPTGTTRSEVEYIVRVFSYDEHGELVEVESSAVLVTDGSAEHQVSVSTRDLPPEVPSAGELFHVFGQAVIDEIEETLVAVLEMAADALVLALSPWEWPGTYRAAGDKVSEYVLTIHENLSPADRAAWEDSVVAAVLLSTGMALTDARDLVDGIVADSFGELAEAWATGDSVSVAQWWGRQVGAAPDVALGALTRSFAVCKLISQRNPWAKSALTAKQARVADQLAALGNNVTATNFPTGAAVSRAHRRAIWGIDDEMFAAVQAFVDDFGIAIGVRRRGPGSLAKIESGTHVPKGYHNKGKNISATDRDWLGFADDLDTSAIKQPPPRSELEAALAAADPDTRARVLARHETRTKEWYGKGPKAADDPVGYQAWLENGAGADILTSERARWLQFAEDGFPVPRNGAPLDYSQNVRAGRSIPPDDVLHQRIRSRVRTEVAPDGRPQMVLEVDYGDGFRPMTGDMDPVVVTKADLSHLPENKRIEFYERAHELGFEHVESASWNNPDGRNGYLQEFSIHNPDSEALFTWMPNQAPRATRFDPQRSWHDPTDNLLEAGMVYLRGVNVHLATADPETGPWEPPPWDRRDRYAPKTMFFVEPGCESDPRRTTAATSPDRRSAGSCSIVFDRGPDALVLRQFVDGSVEQWTAEEGWQPFTVSSTGVVRLLPQSVVTDQAEAGDTVIQIEDADGLELVGGDDEWFAVGDTVVIDPGGPSETTATVTGFGSLVLDAPLPAPVAPGVLVSVLEPLGDPTVNPDPNGPQLPTPPETEPPASPPASPPPGTPPPNGGGGVTQPPPAPGSTRGFSSLAPWRVLDTRPVGAVPGGSVTEVPVLGVGGVPGDAEAVVLNVTVVGPSAAGYATVFPCGQEPPEASNLNFVAGQTVPNAVISKVGVGGKVCVYSDAQADLLIDVNGAFPAGSGFSSLAPWRVLDTRPVGAVPGGSVTEVPVLGVGGVPGDAEAVVLNVTVVGPSAAGYATVFPCGQEPPEASNLNFVAGQTVPNAVISKVGVGGKVCVYSDAQADLLIDVNGAFPR